jgi:hypothetical protein
MPGGERPQCSSFQTGRGEQMGVPHDHHQASRAKVLFKTFFYKCEQKWGFALHKAVSIEVEGISQVGHIAVNIQKANAALAASILVQRQCVSSGTCKVKLSELSQRESPLRADHS